MENGHLLRRCPLRIRCEAVGRLPTPEDGFTLIELVVGIVIMSILMSTAIMSYSGIKRNARDNAMRSAAYRVEESFAVFNRMYPWGALNNVGSVKGDELRLRLGAGGKTATGSGSTALTTPMGDSLLRSWPQNPYASANTPIRIRGYGYPATCTSTACSPPSCPTVLPAGDIAICRYGSNGEYWRLRYFGRDKTGSDILLGERVHGP